MILRVSTLHINLTVVADLIWLLGHLICWRSLSVGLSLHVQHLVVVKASVIIGHIPCIALCKQL